MQSFQSWLPAPTGCVPLLSLPLSEMGPSRTKLPEFKILFGGVVGMKGLFLGGSPLGVTPT
jgi:hypothetical protein